MLVDSETTQLWVLGHALTLPFCILKCTLLDAMQEPSHVAGGRAKQPPTLALQCARRRSSSNPKAQKTTTQGGMEVAQAQNAQTDHEAGRQWQAAHPKPRPQALIPFDRRAGAPCASWAASSAALAGGADASAAPSARAPLPTAARRRRRRRPPAPAAAPAGPPGGPARCRCCCALLARPARRRRARGGFFRSPAPPPLPPVLQASAPCPNPAARA